MGIPIVIEAILGGRDDAAVAERLHEVGHHGVVETLVIAPTDLPRRRFHAETEQGTACFISLPRSTQLFDGAVVHLEAARAIVVRVGAQRWLRLKPDAKASLELGYLAGNLHWRVKFDEDDLLVAVDGPVETYLARLREFRESGKVAVID
jgi:urease accessory protein